MRMTIVNCFIVHTIGKKNFVPPNYITMTENIVFFTN